MDTTAVAMGADEVAKAILFQTRDHAEPINLVRNGSRGMFYLEPLLEVETEAGRVAYGPVSVDDVASLLSQGALEGSDQHPLYLGLTEQIPYLAKQQRLTFTRAGVIDPQSIDDYLLHEGFVGLNNALNLISAPLNDAEEEFVSPSQRIVEQVKLSGLRGRGGAAFPTGIKWQTVLASPITRVNEKKYIVCNADEGDSGTFADRLIMEADPFSLIEGMIIAGLAVGATQGYIYLRSEYPLAQQVLENAIEQAYEHNYLGDNIQGKGHRFDLEVRLGAGAYICGEETSLLESLEGKRGLVRGVLGIFPSKVT